MSVSIDSIRTPARKFSLFGGLLSGRRLPHWAAKFGLRWARRSGGALRIGSRVIAVRHQDVSEVLRRDLDFLIAPVNQRRIEEVNGGPFVLGMDRGEALLRERRALYGALAGLDLDALKAATLNDAQLRLKLLGESGDAISEVARPVAAATAARMFGIGSGDDPLFAEAVRAIFAHTFLNLGDDEPIRARALTAGALMREWFGKEIAERRRTGKLGSDYMGLLLEQGQLDDKGVQRTLGGMLVGSIDTTVSAFAKIFCVVETDPALKQAMTKRWRDGGDIYGYCLEALRLWPHNPIVMRQAAANTNIGKTKVKAGDSVIAWTQAAMYDPAAFPDANRMLPARAPSSYLHFGGELHVCAGRVVNQIQIPILVGTLLDAGARRSGKMRYAGPFPDTLPVIIQSEKTQ